MDDKNVVLCGASAYEQKYYFNKAFSKLPQSIQEELHIICVLFTEEIGGILTLSFDEEGNLQFTTEAKESDYMYDDIGSGLMIKLWIPWATPRQLQVKVSLSVLQH